MSCQILEHERGCQRVAGNLKLSATENKADILKVLAGIETFLQVNGNAATKCPGCPQVSPLHPVVDMHVDQSKGRAGSAGRSEV